jgi:hypothetical protein
MKTLGEAAMDLPWLAPSVASMTTLAKSSLPAAWNEVRHDPGIVLLISRLIDDPVQTPFPADAVLLESLIQRQAHYQTGFVDWNQEGAALIHRSCERTAWLARQASTNATPGSLGFWRR